MCSHESPRGDRKRLKEEYFPLFVLFVLFGQAKRTLKEKNHKDTFLLSYFSVTKSTKSHQRERSPLFENLPRVHEFVARAMRGECVRQRTEQKSVVLPPPAILTIPRVRTYHTREPSRFVHALSARPLDNGLRGRGCSPCADETIKITFISLCLHPVPHPNSNTLSRRRRPRSLRESVNSREVRHSPTWHSSKSESALERFEPVAAAKL